MCRGGRVLCKLVSQSHWLFVDPHITLFPSVVLRLSCLEDVQIPFPSPTLAKYLPALGFLHRQQREPLLQRTWCARGCSFLSSYPFPCLPLTARGFKYITPVKDENQVNLGYGAVFSWSWFRTKMTQTVRSMNVWPTGCPWLVSGQQQTLLCLSLGGSLWLMQYFKR